MFYIVMPGYNSVYEPVEIRKPKPGELILNRVTRAIEEANEFSPPDQDVTIYRKCPENFGFVRAGDESDLYKIPKTRYGKRRPEPKTETEPKPE